MSTSETILVVEDDEDDFFFTQRALRRHTAAPIVHLANGRDAIAYITGTGHFADRAKFPAPAIVLLDLKMEGCGGHEVLAAVRKAPPDPLPQIFVLTGSNESRDRDLVRQSGLAKGFVVKPLGSEHVLEILAHLNEPPRAERGA